MRSVPLGDDDDAAWAEAGERALQQAMGVALGLAHELRRMGG